MAVEQFCKTCKQYHKIGESCDYELYMLDMYDLREAAKELGGKPTVDEALNQAAISMRWWAAENNRRNMT